MSTDYYLRCLRHREVIDVASENAGGPRRITGDDVGGYPHDLVQSMFVCWHRGCDLRVVSEHDIHNGGYLAESLAEHDPFGEAYLHWEDGARRDVIDAINGRDRVAVDDAIERRKAEMAVAVANAKDVPRIYEGVVCGACGSPVATITNNFGWTGRDGHGADWVAYCINMACPRFAGEAEWQDEPDWVVPAADQPAAIRDEIVTLIRGKIFTQELEPDDVVEGVDAVLERFEVRRRVGAKGESRQVSVVAWSPFDDSEYVAVVDAELLEQFKRAIHEWLANPQGELPRRPNGLPDHIRVDQLVDDPADAQRFDEARWRRS